MDRFDLLNKLRNMDEVQLIELLKLTSDEIVDAVLDRIEDMEEELYEQLGDMTLHGYQEDEGL